MVKQKVRKILRYSAICVLLTTVFLMVRVFVFEVYIIPSKSMENYLHRNDFVFVNKLHYGPLMPKTFLDFPFLNIFSTSNNNNRRIRAWKNKEIKYDDVVVFNSPMGNDEVLIKRCVAIPGDTCRIFNGEVYLNGQNVRNEFVKLDYYVPALKKYLGLTDSEFNGIALKSTSKGLEYRVSKGSTVWKNEFNDWSADAIGPLVIPYQGLRIRLDTSSYRLYAHIFKNEGLHFDGASKFYFDGVETRDWIFKHSYYFFCGDNRSHSKDSRFFGLIPEYLVIGRASKNITELIE